MTTVCSISWQKKIPAGETTWQNMGGVIDKVSSKLVFQWVTLQNINEANLGLECLFFYMQYVLFR